MCPHEEDLHRVAAALASLLKPGDVIALCGELGSGKTAFVRGVATALGVPAECVTSPTFVLLQEYPASVPLVHIDTYRLKDPDLFAELGTEELFAEDAPAAVLIEWAERVRKWLPTDCLWVFLDVLPDDARRVTFRACGERSRWLSNRLRCELASGTP